MSRRLYFAYGSNLSLTQMATRCPLSVYHGRATLPDYEFQINQRGVANIIPSPGHCVHGLVYSITASDEARLDRNEGVRSGFYAKQMLGMVVHKAPEGLRIKCARIVEGSGRVEGAVGRAGGLAGGGREKVKWEGEVLVYVSVGFVRRGRAREEYVGRMNTAIEDGLAMGIPGEYFENAVRGFIPRRVRVRARSEGRDGGGGGGRMLGPYRVGTSGGSGSDGRREEGGGGGGSDRPRPVSWTTRDYTNLYGDNPVIRTVTPWSNWLRARGE